jgi:cell division protein ZapA
MRQEAVTVEIYGRSYTLRGVDPELTKRLAAALDRRMRDLAGGSTTADTLKLAILAALNLADDLERLREEALSRTERACARTTELLDRIEAALGPQGPGAPR